MSEKNQFVYEFRGYRLQPYSRTQEKQGCPSTDRHHNQAGRKRKRTDQSDSHKDENSEILNETISGNNCFFEKKVIELLDAHLSKILDYDEMDAKNSKESQNDEQHSDTCGDSETSESCKLFADSQKSIVLHQISNASTNTTTVKVQDSDSELSDEEDRQRNLRASSVVVSM